MECLELPTPIIVQLSMARNMQYCASLSENVFPHVLFPYSRSMCHFSRTVSQFHQSRQVSISRGLHNNLGIYDQSMDELYANGTVIHVSTSTCLQLTLHLQLPFIL